MLPQAPLILICDDQQVVHETLGVYLDAEGYGHASAYDGEQALKMALDKQPDLILLDLMMPKMSGIDVCREVRKTSRAPIIMLTAKGEEIDRVGWALNWARTITSSSRFPPREVLARIKAVLRRSGDHVDETKPVLRFDNIEININKYEVKIFGEPVACTPKRSRDIESVGLVIPGRCLTASRYCPACGGTAISAIRVPWTRRLSVSVRSCRRRAYLGAFAPIYGVGYKFEVNE